jgi:4-diphosphocytidyl-2-C-methyl-D-erythritol kinase
VIERAPAKINLCLFLGPTRADGRHELVTVFEPLRLHDTVTLEPAAEAAGDEVVCPGVEGPNLAARALAAFREATGWDGAPVRLTIDKRIPVAAGMAGGSADAAAALRLARRASGLGDDALLLDLAAGLGADVPAQVRPARLLGTGAGERLRPLPPPARPYGVLVLPSADQLSTAAVFGEADRLGLARETAALAEALADVEAAAAEPPIVNELEPAARSLCPAIDDALDAARAAGARHALVSGSGPTVLGLFDTPSDARRAAAALAARRPAPIAAEPLLPDAVAAARHNVRLG